LLSDRRHFLPVSKTHKSNQKNQIEVLRYDEKLEDIVEHDEQLTCYLEKTYSHLPKRRG
jgi:hypothetical protein